MSPVWDRTVSKFSFKFIALKDNSWICTCDNVEGHYRTFEQQPTDGCLVASTNDIRSMIIFRLVASAGYWCRGQNLTKTIWLSQPATGRRERKEREWTRNACSLCNKCMHGFSTFPPAVCMHLSVLRNWELQTVLWADCIHQMCTSPSGRRRRGQDKAQTTAKSDHGLCSTQHKIARLVGKELRRTFSPTSPRGESW
jgi:hypothetical protein